MVLVIVGIILTTVTLSIGGDPRGAEMQREAQRIIALLQLASEEAVLHNQQLAVHFGADEYRFMVLRDDQWTPLSDDPQLRPRTLPAGIELQLELQDSPPPTLETQESEMPQVFLLSSGEMTPFIVTFSAPQTERRLQVSATLLGRLELQ